MDAKEILAALNASGLSTGLTPQYVELLANVAVPQSYSAGASVVRAGDDCDGLYLVVKGSARVENTFAGTARVVGKLHDGDFFGEVALLGSERRSSSVIADGELHCLLLPAAQMNTIMAKHPAIREHLENVGQRRTTTNLELHLGELPEVE